MGMKFACRHLLCRRDLSCTKVNAVNRLSDGLDVSFGLAEEAGGSLVAAEPAPHWGAEPSCLLTRFLENNWLPPRWVQTEMQLPRLLSILSE